MAIKEFRGDYDFLSNFAPCKIKYEGLTFRSTEAAFQAGKAVSPADKKRISFMGAAESKKAGRALKEIRKDWGTARLQVMEDVLRLKFAQPYFRDKLLATGDEELIEGNWWGDVFWGQDNKTWKGENHLGKLLMKIRDELKKEVSNVR